MTLPWLVAAAPETPAYLLDLEIGEACGRDVRQMERCTNDFGAQGLPMLCRTCPGPGR